jgi:hypothetical protein
MRATASGCARICLEPGRTSASPTRSRWEPARGRVCRGWCPSSTRLRDGLLAARDRCDPNSAGGTAPRSHRCGSSRRTPWLDRERAVRCRRPPKVRPRRLDLGDRSWKLARRSAWLRCPRKVVRRYARSRCPRYPRARSWSGRPARYLSSGNKRRAERATRNARMGRDERATGTESRRSKSGRHPLREQGGV